MSIGTLGLAQRKHMPLLMVHGVDDAEISVANSDKLSQLAGSPTTYLRLDHTGHDDLLALHKQDIYTTLHNFMDKLP